MANKIVTVRGDRLNMIRDPRCFFEINASPYEFIFNYDTKGLARYEHIDFAVVNDFQAPPAPAKRTLLLDIWTADQTWMKKLNQYQHENPNAIVITELILTNQHHPKIIHIDWMFNRTKAYYSQFAFGPGIKPFYHQGNTAYTAIHLSTASNKTKIFTSPGRGHCDRTYRQRLGYLMASNTNLGHASFESVLYSQWEYPQIKSIKELLTVGKPSLTYPCHGYSPVHNAYYQDTFISMYVESLEVGESRGISEKTYDPLIKGHFILPFGYSGLIKDIRWRGIQLPDFIDYSYDDIFNSELRWECYQQEVERLLSIDIDTWRQLWNDNLHIILANQRYFQDRPYDRIDLASLLER